MIDLKHAGIGLRKAAYKCGFRVGKQGARYRNKEVNELGFAIVTVIVEDDSGGRAEITASDIEYAAQFNWSDIKKGRV